MNYQKRHLSFSRRTFFYETTYLETYRKNFSFRLTADQKIYVFNYFCSYCFTCTDGFILFSVPELHMSPLYLHHFVPCRLISYRVIQEVFMVRQKALFEICKYLHKHAYVLWKKRVAHFQTIIFQIKELICHVY